MKKKKQKKIKRADKKDLQNGNTILTYKHFTCQTTILSEIAGKKQMSVDRRLSVIM